MLGRDHLATGFCSAILITDGLFAVKSHYNGPFSDTVKNYSVKIIDTMIHPFGWNIFLSLSVGCILFAIGLLLPDIDTRKSMLGRIIYVPIRHRTWTHSIWLPLLFSIATIWCPVLWWLIAGILIHLFWDSLSKGGLCWFYPISKYRTYGDGAQVKKHHILSFYKTGCMSEYIIVTLVILLTIFVTIVTFLKKCFI